MKFARLSICTLLIFSCQAKPTKSELEFKATLHRPLTEISGIKADGGTLWAITDKPSAEAYKINLQGEVIQHVEVKGIQAIDVEAVTTDNDFVYIGDVGDNDGDREQRQIIKFRKSQTGSQKEAIVEGETIKFRFSDEQIADKKKRNNYDCESMLSFGDSLYLFTKRREDHYTELFVLPKAAGSYTARSLGIFDSHGLVTDAAINTQGNEVALCGYHKGHKYPFILLLKNFTGNNFIGGKQERIVLTNKPWDWQIEGITYTDDGKVYFSCERTKEVDATLYGIKRDKLQKLNK